MTKKFRDLFFISFIALFFIITFFVSVYAVGYTLRLSWPLQTGQIFQKTGMLILDSEPDGASIYLNGEKQRKPLLLDIGRQEISTPTRIKNLSPGEYSLRLEKEGYWPLEKKIKIEPGQSTFAENLILFKRSLPLNLTLCAPQEISISPDKKNIILTADGNVINLKTEAIEKISSSSDAKIQWSKDGGKVLLDGNLLDLTKDKNANAISVIGSEAKNFYWDEQNSRIYYQVGNNISCILTNDSSASTILSGGNYSAYTVKNNFIYTIEKQDDNTWLKIYRADNSLLQSSSIIPDGDYSFIHGQYRLDLYDRRQKSLYIISENTDQPIIRQIKPIEAWQWLDQESLVWRNEFEIYSLNGLNNRQQLLIRVGEPLTGLAWNKSKNYLIYSSAEQINIINLSLEELAPISLLKAEQISNLALEDKSQILYFFAKIGQQSGIYKLQLQ